MEQVLQFFLAYEMWIYGVLGLLAFWYIFKFARAWEELRSALFGMERENAQARLNRAATMLVILLIGAVAEFALVTFVVPAVPGVLPIPSPTLDLYATPTTTLSPASLGVGQTALAPPAGETTLTPTGLAALGCVPGQIELLQPGDGDSINGVVTLIGTVDIENFGFYVYEISRPGETLWLPLQVGRQPVREGELGAWDTSVLSPGEYQLRLVVTDNQGNVLPPCVIRVQVAP